MFALAGIWTQPSWVKGESNDRYTIGAQIQDQQEIFLFISKKS